MAVRLFGIRHHGPGCARSLASALADYEPDCILIEGPPDAQEALGHVADRALEPPVALLVHAVDDPRRAVFYPFASFSPEWQALRFGAARQVPTRFIDLPCAHRLNDAEHEHEHEEEDGEALSEDPIGVLAEAAGFADREQWWDAQVEQRTDPAGLFEAIAEAMTTLRSEKAPRKREAQREAHMRQCIRQAEGEGFQRLAVVCGAWHVPALVDRSGVKADQALLKGLPKEKVSSTWIPWTHSRLSFASGYGAGVESPGFYAHVWEHGARAPLVWCVRAARLLRGNDLDASSASVIETVRLAETLAAIRELPAPGLSELREAILSVLCRGEQPLLALIRQKLEIGESLGRVPDEVAAVPVQRDFERELKRLRLKLTTEQVVVELDLRKELDVDKSRLVHRSRILGLDWAQSFEQGRGTGTFKEGWKLAWRPELAVSLVAANLYGNTMAAAARGRLRERAEAAGVDELSHLIEVARLADLPEVHADLLGALDRRAASTNDVRVLLDATEPLSRLIRYGDVRGGSERNQSIVPVFRALVERALVGLLPAATQLDDDAARSLLESLERGHAAILLLELPELETDWLAKLFELLSSDAAHPRLRGRAVRLLHERGRLTTAELERTTSLALSLANDPAAAARWLEGLVAGEGLFLVHQEALLAALDQWLAGLSSSAFQAQLPLLRRAFSDFAAAERRALAQALKTLGRAEARRPSAGADFDVERAARALPVLELILGGRA
jgi:Family of unknown function (DUF5682)